MSSPLTNRMCGGGGVLVGTVVKEKVGELEDEVREVFSRRMRMDLTGVVQRVSGKRRFLAIFQDWCDKVMTLNQLRVVTENKSPVKNKPRC